MRKFLNILLALVLFGLLTGFAFAQEAVAQGFDIGSWFVDTAALAGVVVAVVAFLRAHVLKGVEGFGVVLVSLGVGAGLGVAGSFLGYVEGGIVAAVGFGLSAGLLASGGWDAITGALGKRQAAPSLEG